MQPFSFPQRHLDLLTSSSLFKDNEKNDAEMTLFQPRNSLSTCYFTHLFIIFTMYLHIFTRDTPYIFKMEGIGHLGGSVS